MFYSAKIFMATTFTYVVTRMLVILVCQNYLGRPFLISDIFMSFEYLLLFIGTVTVYVHISKGHSVFRDYAMIRGSNKYLADLCNIVVFVFSLALVCVTMEAGFHSLIGPPEDLMSVYVVAREALAISLGLSLSWWLFLKKIYAYLSEEEAEIFFAEQGYDESSAERAVTTLIEKGRIRSDNEN